MEMLANNEMGLLDSFLNSFEELFGMFAGPNAFLAFSELIIEVIMLKFLQLVLKDNLNNTSLL